MKRGDVLALIRVPELGNIRSAYTAAIAKAKAAARTPPDSNRCSPSGSLQSKRFEMQRLKRKRSKPSPGRSASSSLGSAQVPAEGRDFRSLSELPSTAP